MKWRSYITKSSTLWVCLLFYSIHSLEMITFFAIRVFFFSFIPGKMIGISRMPSSESPKLFKIYVAKKKKIKPATQRRIANFHYFHISTQCAKSNGGRSAGHRPNSHIQPKMLRWFLFSPFFSLLLYRLARSLAHSLSAESIRFVSLKCLKSLVYWRVDYVLLNVCAIRSTFIYRSYGVSSQLIHSLVVDTSKKTRAPMILHASRQKYRRDEITKRKRKTHTHTLNVIQKKFPLLLLLFVSCFKRI